MHKFLLRNSCNTRQCPLQYMWTSHHTTRENLSLEVIEYLEKQRQIQYHKRISLYYQEYRILYG
jgi:hypothetical protein